MKVLDSYWFTNPMGTIGIVLGEDETTKEKKAYIGNASLDNSQQEDEERILRWGSTYPIDAAKFFFSYHF